MSTLISSGALISRGPRFGSPALFDAGPTIRRSPSCDPTTRAGRKYFRYFRESAEAPVSAPRVIGLGRAEVLPGEAYPPRNHPKLYSFDWRAGRTLPEHQVLFLSDAAGEFESHATGRVRLLGDVLIFLFPGMWHRYRPLTGGGWTERWLSLYGDVVRNRLAGAGLTAESPLRSPSDPGRLRLVFDTLLSAVEADSHAACANASRAFVVFDEAVEQATDVRFDSEELMAANESEVDDEIVQLALEIIWNDRHCPPLGVSDVARQLPVTRRTLDRRFADTLGRTVLDEINACRLSRAKRLLADTDLPIKAVAFRAGFPSRERLRLAFLNHEGMPPSEYREAIRRQRESGNV